MPTVTTTVALVGPHAADLAARSAATAANVSLATAPDHTDDLLERHDRHLAAWRDARRHPPVYTLVPLDPLQVVVETWAMRLTGDRHADIETVIGLTPAEPMPHYYVVDPDIADPQIHWYHGLLGGLSPTRVIPSSLDPRSIRKVLEDLPTGRELPNMQQVATEARDYVPVPQLAR